MTARIRRTAAVALAAGLLLGTGAAAGPAIAATPAGVSAEQAVRMNAVQRVTAFFDQYVDAVNGTNPNMNPQEVRSEFLTPELDAELTAWAEANQADPVFRAQNTPQDRAVRYEGGGAGLATVVVTEYFEAGDPIEVWYQVPLWGGKISGLTDAPA